MIEPILTTDLIFFFQAEDGIRDVAVTGVQTCALPIYSRRPEHNSGPLGASCGDLVCCGRAAPTGSACWCWQCRCRSWWYRRPAASARPVASPSTDRVNATALDPEDLPLERGSHSSPAESVRRRPRRLAR